MSRRAIDTSAYKAVCPLTSENQRKSTVGIDSLLHSMFNNTPLEIYTYATPNATVPCSTRIDYEYALFQYLLHTKLLFATSVTPAVYRIQDT